MTTAAMVQALKDDGQDYEWYPTTDRMLAAVGRDLGKDTGSILDIGAGDGRALIALGAIVPHAQLFSIERAPRLQQAQPPDVIPVGTEFWEQDLMALPVDVILCNPPYSDHAAWAGRIIDTCYARTCYLILPQRWEADVLIAESLKRREASARIIHRDDFLAADRASRAVVHVVRVSFPSEGGGWGRRSDVDDPFDRWFDQNIDTFDKAEAVSDYQQEQKDLARLHTLDSIQSLVAAYGEEYARLEANYKAIFQLDHAILKELGVNKQTVREGLKKRMAGLKHTYWAALFQHLEVITARLTTKTKKGFLDRINGSKAVAFTASNCYAVVLWAIKYANRYFDDQLIDTFREFSTHEGVTNYTSNVRTWEKHDWRYKAEDHSHYRLDYRVVLDHHSAIMQKGTFGRYDYPGDLYKDRHDQLDDLIAVWGNLGFRVQDTPSRSRAWASGQTQDFKLADGRTLFEVRAFLNGNMHFRFLPEAIKALNIEASRLLKWVGSAEEAAGELGYSPADVRRYWLGNQQLGPGSVKLLGQGS